MTASARQRRSTELSLVIASLDEGSELHETIRSVLTGDVLPADIIVVDDGGTDGSCAALERDEWRSRGVSVHRTERRGIAAARNAGSRLARGSRLAFVDAHCRLNPGCLAALEEALDAHPDAIIAPSVCDHHGGVFGCGARLIDAHLRYRWLRPPASNGASGRVPIVPGGCLALGQATFERLGGFGRFRELGLEDVELGLRAWRAGVDVIATPSARLAHRFRSTPPYTVASTSRAYNVARVALVHFDGRRRAECLRTLVGTARAAEALVDAFASDWEDTRAAIASTSQRTIEAFFERFGDWG